MIKLLIGGSPCTKWSIAQKNGRETKPSGIGWELFVNYLIAKQKFKPDFFLYENNKSAAQAIKDQIQKELGVWDGSLFMEDTGARYIEINSALVSAQNRQRFYVHNCGNVEQPEDRGILLRDILESGENLSSNEKSYALTTRCAGGIPEDTLKRRRHTMVAEPINTTEDGKAQCVRACFYKDGIRNLVGNTVDVRTAVAIPVCEPVCVQEQVFGRKANDDGTYDRRYEARVDGKSGTLTGTMRQNAVAEPIVPFVEKRLDDAVAKYGYIPEMWNPYNNSEITDKAPTQMTNCGSQTVSSTVLMCEKATTLCGQGGVVGAKTGLYACPVYELSEEYYKGGDGGNLIGMTVNGEGKYRNGSQPSQQYRVYSCEGKSQVVNTLGNENYIIPCDGEATTLCGQGGGVGTKTGLYACPMVVTEATKKGYAEIHPGECVDLTFPKSKTRRGRRMSKKANCLTTASSELYEYCGTVDKPIYEVKDGFIVIKGKQYPIKLKDGYYIIRKLTPIECERLQTLPDDYTSAVSNSQRYKGLGNGWTAEVIIHILNGALKDVPRDEEIVVLSMYDGIGTGRYCLDKMGFTNVKYYAYEIDKYAKQVAMSNYPDIIQCGDAFDVRKDDWELPRV